LTFEIGLLKVKECENFSSLKNMTKIETNQIFNKSFLSQVKLKEEKANKIYLFDEKIKLKIPINKHKW